MAAGSPRPDSSKGGRPDSSTNPWSGCGAPIDSQAALDASNEAQTRPLPRSSGFAAGDRNVAQAVDPASRSSAVGGPWSTSAAAASRSASATPRSASSQRMRAASMTTRHLLVALEPLIGARRGLQLLVADLERHEVVRAERLDDQHARPQRRIRSVGSELDVLGADAEEDRADVVAEVAIGLERKLADVGEDRHDAAFLLHPDRYRKFMGGLPMKPPTNWSTGPS